MDDNTSWNLSAIFAPQNQPRVEAAFQEELARSLKDGFTQDELNEARVGLLNRRRLALAQDAPAHVGRQEAPGLAGEVQQDRARFEQRHRLAVRPVGIDDGRDLVVGADGKEVGLELFALADVHRMHAVRKAAFLQHDVHLVPVGRGPRIHFDHGPDLLAQALRFTLAAMLELFRRWFGQASRDAPEVAPLRRWAEAAGWRFAPARGSEGFVVEATGEGPGWRAEWGPAWRSRCGALRPGRRRCARCAGGHRPRPARSPG
jgi:hypothetical protein